jgi:hypothetical protein
MDAIDGPWKVLESDLIFNALPNTFANMRRKYVSQPGLKSTFQSHCFYSESV